MFKNLGKLKYISSKSFKNIEIANLANGINSLDSHIVYKKENYYKVYDRKCDHAGGKIISKGQKQICPIHNWEFNPAKGEYSNSVKKKECKYSVEDNKIRVIEENLIPKITNINSKSSYNIHIRFFNHAFLLVSSKKYSFATDPWAFGPAFNTGWWLKQKTKEDWLEKLNKVDFIYISHNHPDHLHPLTLSKINKNIPIIVPKFVSDSTGIYCESLGFKNIFRMEFENQYQLLDTSLVFSILKSGDFREDSGLYFLDNKFSFLSDVDSNILNFERFPKVDFYASSFAGGASGYPMMFENYDENEKKKL
jgi:CMP-N-acetylneuraminate monooxygenase